MVSTRQQFQGSNKVFRLAFLGRCISHGHALRWHKMPIAIV
jgi:hypothetical protein